MIEEGVVSLMKRKIKSKLLIAGTIAALGLFVGSNSSYISAKSYHKAVTKIAGNGNYAVYHYASKMGPSGKFTSTKYFKHAQIQSKQSIATKKGKFWKIIVDGRTVGWVNQNFFARNKISVAQNVSLVQNNQYSFNTKDAINYVTNSAGTAVDTSKVTVSKSKINSGTPGKTTVDYSYGKAKATVNVTVRSEKNEGIARADKKPMNGPKEVSTWKGSSKSSSRN